jgi:feruloyl esterase
MQDFRIIVAGLWVLLLARPLWAQEGDVCTGLASRMAGRWPDASTQIVSAVTRQAGELPAAPAVNAPSPTARPVLPEHCELIGTVQQRRGVDAQRYAIRFHLRLPARWNGRFYFQGGGGTNGELGDALGSYNAGAPPALLQGYAVVSQDSGHDNATNSDPARNGSAAFGFDPQARANYGYASLQPVADAAKAAIAQFYGRKPRYSYFVGCSKGGEEGMAAAQRLPLEFDGIVAGSPGFSLPRAAVAEAWDAQSYAAIAQGAGADHAAFAQLKSAFSDADLELLRAAILAACDADDGLEDGIVGAVGSCTDRKVLPALAARTCVGPKAQGCLSGRQVEALKRAYAGPKDSADNALYSDWPWDAGVSGQGWRQWKIGSADGRVPALSVVLAGPALSAVFTTPPTRLAADPQSYADFVLHFDFDRDAPRIYARDATFTHSAWQDLSARSPDLDAFRARRGRLIVSHGVSDPVFSLNDTLAWLHEVQQRTGGHAGEFIRVFPVPGMQHCAGGPATDRFDTLAALVDWVEHARAPEQLLARAGPSSPWPDRTRPLCAYPATAHYRGHGDIERASSFRCE